MPASIVWFRNDLRLADNPALAVAGASGHAVVPVYVLDEETAGIRRRGSASRWWLHHSLAALDKSLHRLGSRLILRRGRAEEVIAQLASQCDASAVYWNRSYDPSTGKRDAHLREVLRMRGIVTEESKGDLLYEPTDVVTGIGAPFKVFTPFWKVCRKLDPPQKPLPAPKSLTSPADWPAGDGLDTWNLLPVGPDWSAGLGNTWAPGEKTAHLRLATFLEQALPGYREKRDLPAIQATSRLSPHLAFGEISPRQIWAAVMGGRQSSSTDKFLAELGWREFSYYLQFNFGDLTRRNFRAEFNAFPWAGTEDGLRDWQRGLTGYPIVDAGMRELWTTGWMHNRVRMIVASFLVKDLLLDWRLGEEWFWDTLVDADPASNVAGWQWVAGCGADAAPYFRIFNPVLQGEKFDPEGDYVRRWVPEIADLPASSIHRPWASQPNLFGKRYPTPIVDHAFARTRALAAFQTLKASA